MARPSVGDGDTYPLGLNFRVALRAHLAHAPLARLSVSLCRSLSLESLAVHVRAGGVCASLAIVVVEAVVVVCRESLSSPSSSSSRVLRAGYLSFSWEVKRVTLVIAWIAKQLSCIVVPFEECVDCQGLVNKWIEQTTAAKLDALTSDSFIDDGIMDSGSGSSSNAAQQQQQQQQQQAAYPGGDRQQFCVSWNSHQSNMHSAFPKLLSSEQFVDVTLACDGGSIKCHKVVLSACSDYLERLLLELPCQHPIIFLRDMRMWELQALVEFMYRGEVYVEQQQLAKLMQAAEALQVRGLSTQGRDSNGPSESSTSMNANSSTPLKPSPAKPTTTSSAASSVGNPDFAQCDDNQSNDEGSESDFLGGGGLSTSLPPNLTATPVGPQENNPLSATNFMNMEHSEALHHLEKALSACEATLTETPGMVKMEPDEHQMMQHHEKPYSISAVPSSNCAPGSPFPAIEGYQRRQRRSEAELKQASDLVARGMTFQVASEKYNIPISTIRFYMARKGILQRRKRGRGSSQAGANSQPSSPASPPFHMMNFRLPESLNSSLQ